MPIGGGKNAREKNRSVTKHGGIRHGKLPGKQGTLLFAYLTAFVYWLGLSLGALLLLMIFHASHAKWPVVVWRMLAVLCV